jgi:hypothetical protein
VLADILGFGRDRCRPVRPWSLQSKRSRPTLHPIKRRLAVPACAVLVSTTMVETLLTR